MNCEKAHLKVRNWHNSVVFNKSENVNAEKHTNKIFCRESGQLVKIRNSHHNDNSWKQCTLNALCNIINVSVAEIALPKQNLMRVLCSTAFAIWCIELLSCMKKYFKWSIRDTYSIIFIVVFATICRFSDWHIAFWIAKNDSEFDCCLTVCWRGTLV